MGYQIIGLDIGDQRIGISIADRDTPFPVPLTTLEAGAELAKKLHHIIESRQVTDVVVGLPRNQQGEKTQQSTRVEKIVSLLKIPENVNLYWQDESLTSVKAEQELKKRGKSYDKKDVDMLAATYILDDFVNSVMRRGNLKDQSNKPASRSKSEKPKKNGKKFSLKKLIVTAVFLIVVLGIVGSILWYFNGLRPRTSEDAYHIINVDKGDSSSGIAKKLEEKTIIKDQKAFVLYLKLNGVNTLQAGSYKLSSKQSVPDIVDIIEKGAVSKISILIPPGLRIDEIVDRLEKEGFEKSDIEAGLEAARSHQLLKNLPKNARLEGYIFPDTYNIGSGVSAEAFFRLALDNLQSKITPDLRQALENQGLTVEQAIIMASIVQKEAHGVDDQKTIAQVFLKRLKEGVVLGADPTFKYAAAQFGEANSPNSQSPYNTRLVKGLPPTAISNFNLSALEAVAYPTATDYNFFVAGDDGTTHFSRTEAEHEALTRQYCTTLCR